MSRKSLFKEYDATLIERAELAKELEEKDARLEELRRELHGKGSNGNGAKKKASFKKPIHVTPAIAEAVASIKKMGGKAKCGALAEELGITPGATAIRLSKGVELGLLERVDYGTYGIVKEEG